MGTLVLILDLIGTFVFALSEATMGVRRRLDIFGVLVLSFAAALAGGITRDLLIGATPVAAISDWRYPAITLAAGIVTFFWAPLIERMQYPVRMFKIRTGNITLKAPVYRLRQPRRPAPSDEQYPGVDHEEMDLFNNYDKCNIFKNCQRRSSAVGRLRQEGKISRGGRPTEV
ncbi:hypothetical protein AOT14_17290 [Stenotrophomonas acidaminiphila]|uniref:Glycine transporter domain-containing protein n=1 Tax=Stenotrophomonas acidaminiphila TaxID=128780 RepID=A0A0S1AZE9_9GAMM|nr:TRIC cation channel family protein [Stenotrophomonas acidaminiphila]ALJ28116.1 hypothetical protein AOT14_17290 [Stenotrophomonas acidaminiphila]